MEKPCSNLGMQPIIKTISKLSYFLILANRMPTHKGYAYDFGIGIMIITVILRQFSVKFNATMLFPWCEYVHDRLVFFQMKFYV